MIEERTIMDAASHWACKYHHIFDIDTVTRDKETENTRHNPACLTPAFCCSHVTYHLLTSPRARPASVADTPASRRQNTTRR